VRDLEVDGVEGACLGVCVHGGVVGEG
jgi:hypothetical protein